MSEELLWPNWFRAPGPKSSFAGGLIVVIIIFFSPFSYSCNNLYGILYGFILLLIEIIYYAHWDVKLF
jgi:hypothetical protein